MLFDLLRKLPRYPLAANISSFTLLLDWLEVLYFLPFIYGMSLQYEFDPQLTMI